MRIRHLLSCGSLLPAVLFVAGVLGCNSQPEQRTASPKTVTASDEAETSIAPDLEMPQVSSVSQVEELLLRIKGREASNKESILEQLVATGIDAVSVLIDALSDQDEQVRDLAKDALVRIGDPAKPLLTEALGARSGAAHQQIQDVLSKLPGSVLPAYLAALEQRSSPAYEETIDQVLRLGPSVLPALVSEATKEVWNSGARETVIRFGGRAVPELEKQLDSPSPEVRRNTIEILGEIGRPAAHALSRALRDENFYVFMSTIAAFENLGPGNKHAVAELLKQTEHEDPQRRFMAAELLFQVSPSRAVAVPALMRVIREDENQGRRADAARLLAPLGEHLVDELDVLIQIIETETNDYVRDACIQAIGHMRTESVAKATPVLVNALLDDSASASQVLLRPGLELTPYIPQLIESAYRDDDLRDFIVRLGDSTTPFLRNALSEDNRELRLTVLSICHEMQGAANDLVPDLVKVFDEQDDLVVARAASAVGSIKRKPELAVRPLIKLLGHPAEDVRREAARALSQFGAAAEPAIPHLRRAIEQESDPDAREFMEWCHMRIREST